MAEATDTSMLRNWMKNVWKLNDRIEDVVDTYAIKILSGKEVGIQELESIMKSVGKFHYRIEDVFDTFPIKIVSGKEVGIQELESIMEDSIQELESIIEGLHYQDAIQEEGVHYQDEEWFYQAFYYDHEEIPTTVGLVERRLPSGAMTREVDWVLDYSECHRRYDSCSPLRELQKMMDKSVFLKIRNRELLGNRDEEMISKKLKLIKVLRESPEIVLLTTLNIKALTLIKDLGWDGDVTIPPFVGEERRNAILTELKKLEEKRPGRKFNTLLP